MERQKSKGVCSASATPPQSAGATNSVVKLRADAPPSLLLESTAYPTAFHSKIYKTINSTLLPQNQGVGLSQNF